MNRHLRRFGVLALTATLALALVGPVQAARISETQATTAVASTAVKAVVKVGARCTKLNAKAKVGSTQLVCKRVNGKLIWSKVKISADCKAAREQYAVQTKSYQDIITQTNAAKASLAGLTGADADALRAQITELEKALGSLAPVLRQFKIATEQICALS